jgi:ArsR family transcriptional regulator, arsenate/arsenite/antimonite-responsive transcriptional repressor
MERGKALSALSALANDARLDLVRLLMPEGHAGLAAGDIARALGLSASRLSFHLASLQQAGLITARKQARHVFYAVDAGGMGATIAYLLNDCCMQHPEVVACCRHRRDITQPLIQTSDQPQES